MPSTPRSTSPSSVSASQVGHPPRFVELDGLRGVAAAVVVLHHALLTLPAAWATFNGHPADKSGVIWWLMKTPFYLVFSGPAAVMVFFVLSGSVLTLTYLESDRGNYLSYLPKRIARIWIPFAVAILSSSLAMVLVHPTRVPALSGWFNTYSWNEKLDLRAVLKHLAMLGPNTWLDNPMWSLVYELRISIIFPLLLLATMRARYATLAVCAATVVLAANLIPTIGNPFAANLLSTLEYFLAFSAGAALMLSREQIRERLSRPSGRIGGIVLVLLGLVLLLANGPADAVIARIPAAVRDLPVALGAAVIVGVALAGHLPVLATRQVHWLGRISYSLYLIHVPVLLTVLHLTGGRNIAFGLLSSVVLSLVLADFMQRTIERGSQRFGRRIAFKLNGLRAPQLAL